jgi:outer membrane protein assembly factor BamE (lipoprotein component of BamABCDE complex)
MFRRAAAFVLASTVLVGACTPITSYQGFQAVEANPKDVKVGVDSKSTVMDRLGSPSAVAAFDPNTWYYISQISDQMAFHRSNVRRREIVAIAFNKGDDKVTAVNDYTLKDGHVVPFNSRATPTRGRELSVIEQILGNIGQGGMMPQEDINPGSQRPR